MEQERKKEIKFNWVLILIFLSIALLLFQGIYVLVSLDKLMASLSQEPQYLELMETYEVQEEMFKNTLRAIAFFWLALACWMGFGIFQIKEKKAFLHFLIPSVLALITGRWEVGICGIIASIVYKRKLKIKNIKSTS